MTKLLKNSTFLIFSAAAVFLIGCGKETSKENYVVRVNKTYLNSSELDTLLTNSNQFRNELIRDWINKELLYQVALKEGITDSKEFKNILETTRKELAVTLWTDKYLKDMDLSFSTDDVRKYYEEHKGTFTLDDNSYLLNLIYFKDENTAIKFRGTLLESNWPRASGAYKNNEAKVFEERNSIQRADEIYPASLEKILYQLNPSEVSIVFNDENKYYYVVQLINKFTKGTIPPFEFIKTEAEKRYVQEQKEIALRDYLQELYSKNDIEIRTGKK